MERPTRFENPTRLAAAGAARTLVAALLFAGPARAIEPAATWSSASPITAPGARCDLATAGQIEESFERGFLMPLSSYDDDPFADDATVECLPGGGFAETADGRLLLASAHVTIEDEPFIYRFDPAEGVFEKLAWNPWPRVALSAADGSFRYPAEPRFPLFEIERGPDGSPSCATACRCGSRSTCTAARRRSSRRPTA
jgi:hypothetical protein